MGQFEEISRAQKEFHQIRELIQRNDFAEALTIISVRLLAGKASTASIGLFLKAILEKGEFEPQYWSPLRNIVIERLQQLEGDFEPDWITNVFLEAIYQFEGELHSSRAGIDWAVEKSRKILATEKIDLTQAESLLEFVDGQQSNKSWKYFWVKGVLARRKHDTLDASVNFMSSFAKCNDNNFPIGTFLEFFIETNTSLQQIETQVLNQYSRFLECDRPCDGKVEKILDLMSYFRSSSTKFKSYQISNVSVKSNQTNLNSPEKGVFTGSHVNVVKDIDFSESEILREYMLYSPGRFGRFVYFVKSDAEKVNVRKSAFVRNAIWKMEPKSVIEIEIESLKMFSNFSVPRKFIVNPGRVGSTLLHNVLRESGIESISETWSDWMLPDLVFRGFVEKEESLMISQLETHSLFNEKEARSLVVKKLPGRSSKYIDSLVGEGEQAIFLFRDIEGYLSSWRNLGGSPERCVESLINTLRAYGQLKKRMDNVEVLWYDEIVSFNKRKLEELFGVSIVANPKSLLEDSQKDTAISREALSSRVPKWDLKEYVKTWNSSSGPLLAQEMDFSKLISSVSPTFVASSRSTFNAKIRVIPGNIYGSSSHYYHFLLGLLLPFIDKEYSRHDKSTYFFPDLGPMNRHISELTSWGWRCFTDDAGVDNKRQIEVTYQGWDHESMFRYVNFESVRDKVFRILEISNSSRKLEQSYLIVNRGKMKVQTEKGETYADARRSTPNLKQVVSHLQKEHKVKFVELEELSLREQIVLFNEADVVVAQHGAALANLVWCKPSTKIVEIIDSRKRSPAFKELSKRMSFKYIRFDQLHPKSNIDILKLKEVLLNI